MNMILHNNPTALIVQGNTLADPNFKDGHTLKTFDYVGAIRPSAGPVRCRPDKANGK
jgi:type I restriction enzyme M protein